LGKYYYGDQIKEDEMGGPCSTIGRYEKCRHNLIGNLEGKGPLGKSMREREDKMNCILRK
jgi:hypothetical protein